MFIVSSKKWDIIMKHFKTWKTSCNFCLVMTTNSDKTWHGSTMHAYPNIYYDNVVMRHNGAAWNSYCCISEAVIDLGNKYSRLMVCCYIVVLLLLIMMIQQIVRKSWVDMSSSDCLEFCKWKPIFDSFITSHCFMWFLGFFIK